MFVKIKKPNLYDVFISYSRKDRVIAERIYTALRDAGVDAFMDVVNIHGGQDFLKAVSHNILTSKVFLSLVSNNYYSSNFALDELSFAKSHKRRESIYIYNIDGSELPFEYDFATAAINRKSIDVTPIEKVVDDIKLLLENKKIIQESLSANSIDIKINTASFFSNIGIRFTGFKSLIRKYLRKKNDENETKRNFPS
jgi:hypothetical protein